MVIDKPKCEECGDSMVYLRLKKNELVCRKCGHISKIDERRLENKDE